MGEIHRKQCYSLFRRITEVENQLLNEYASYAIDETIRFAF